MPHLGPVQLTKPCLLVPLHLDGEAEVSQLDGSTLQLGCQQQVLGLQEEKGVEEEQKDYKDLSSPFPLCCFTPELVFAL